MGNITINLLFAAVFGGFAWNSLPRGWRFFSVGWQAFRTNAGQSKADIADIEQQRNLEAGSTFLLAGIAWLSGGIISAILSILFVIFAFLDIGFFNLIS